MSWLKLSALLLLLYLAGAEWVEIPQFSDQQKVYRMPPFRTYHSRQPPRNSDRRVYVDDDRYGHHQTAFHRETSLRNISRFYGNRYPTYPNDEPPYAATIATFTTERIVSSIETEPDNTDPDEGIAIESVEDDEPEFEEIPVLYSSSAEVTTNFNTGTTTTVITSTTEPPKPIEPPKPTQHRHNETDNDKGFIDYLPVDLLRRVHQTLKSQPSTLKGKIRFLKAFERTLIEEIKSRLSTALAPTRKTRGAREHEHHDDGIGFPSLEGTLMAISFLTFAVYLVRLVMLLFRNATNIGTPPIFIGRKKRSIDDYSEEAARILSYLDSSSAQYYKSRHHFSHIKNSF